MKCVRIKRDGKRCSAWAMKGGTLCAKHGGKAPQIMAASERKLALRRAERMVQLAGVDMDPIDHLLDSLYRQTAILSAYGMLVAELGDNELTEINKLGDRKVHTFMVAYERANQERARVAKMCGELKIGEKQMALIERLGEQAAMLWERTMASIPGLTEVQRLAGAQAYAREIALLERPAIDGTARDVA